MTHEFIDVLLNNGFSNIGDGIYQLKKELDFLYVVEQHSFNEDGLLLYGGISILVKDWIEKYPYCDKTDNIFNEYYLLSESIFSEFSIKDFADDTVGMTAFDFVGNRILLKDENFLAHLYKFASEVKPIICQLLIKE